MHKMPKNLVPGDTIAIVAPAKAIEAEHVEYAKSLLEKKGYKVLVGENCLGRNNYFSGTDEERRADFQWALDHPEVKAILCARGGYGCVRILDKIQWASYFREPKWILGFSDVTVFHLKSNTFGVPSIHATMPLNFQNNSLAALNTLFYAMEGGAYKIETPWNPKNKLGEVSGELIGGNLSIVYSMLGTPNINSFKDKILFIEEVGEHVYAVDRMLFALKQAGVFDQIAGLIVGGMTSMKDTDPGFGEEIENLILDQLYLLKKPVAFGFPAGHIDDNRALIFGTGVELSVNPVKTSLRFLERT